MTIFSEIEYYWIPAKHSLSFFLFVTNRYIGILGPIPVFFEYFSEVSEHVSVHLEFVRETTFVDTCYSGQLLSAIVQTFPRGRILTPCSWTDVGSCNCTTRFLRC